MSPTPGLAMDFLGRVAYEMYQMKPLIPTYVHLLVSAIFPIYTAAHASLARPSSAAPARKKEISNASELQDEEISPTIETLTPSDAILFLLLAGATLASLYFILKWLQDPALLNYYLGLYFAFVGLFFTIKFIKDGLSVVRSLTLPNQYTYGGKIWKLAPGERRFIAAGDPDSIDQRTSPLPGIFSILFQRYNSAIWSLRTFVYTRLNLKLSIWKLINLVTCIDTLDLISIAIATPLVYYHTLVDKPWFLTNLLGFSFCYGSLQITTPGTSWTGTLLLSALFFYDIYFVFYTPMMVTVATKLDVPIKLLFPRPDGCKFPVGALEGSEAMEEYLQCIAKKRTMAMLGLGDIVIPGIMLAFALRFDLYMYYHKLAAAAKSTSTDNKNTSERLPYSPATGLWGERFWTSSKLHSPELQAKRFPKTYFNASVIGYILGMIATVVVMQVSQHAQPALLYLVPGVLTAFWGVALVQGDFKALWHYSEVPEELESKDADKKPDHADKGEKQKLIEAKDDTDSRTEENTVASDDPAQEASMANQSKNNDTKAKIKSAEKQKKTAKEIDSDDHLFFFSLSIVKLSKTPEPEQTSTVTTDSESADTEHNRSSTETSTSSNSSSELRSDTTSGSTDDWPSNSDDEEAGHNNVEENANGTSNASQDIQPITTTTTGADANSHIHARDEATPVAEPALKKRRKA